MELLLCVSRGGRKKKNLLTRDQSVSPSTPILASSPFTRFLALAKVEKIKPWQFCLEMEVAETIRGSLRTRAKCRATLDGFCSTVVRSGTERDGSGKRTGTVMKNLNGTGK